MAKHVLAEDQVIIETQDHLPICMLFARDKYDGSEAWIDRTAAREIARLLLEWAGEEETDA